VEVGVTTCDPAAGIARNIVDRPVQMPLRSTRQSTLPMSMPGDQKVLIVLRDFVLKTAAASAFVSIFLRGVSVGKAFVSVLRTYRLSGQ
jgi:hypothetical protein